LAHLAQVIAATGASVQQIEHDRAFGGADVTAVNVLCTVETFGAAHIEELLTELADRGITIVSR
jgi:threonine dehydratase